MAKRIEVTYLPEPIVDSKTDELLGRVFRPKIPIQISYKRLKGHLFQALVDSGSDKNLFPSGLGELVGIDIRTGKESFIYGIGESKIVAYEHEVDLHLQKLSLPTRVDFSFSQRIPLLGREGFFDLFKRVDFNEKKKLVGFRV